MNNNKKKIVEIIVSIATIIILAIIWKNYYGGSNYKEYEEIASRYVNSEGYGTIVDTSAHSTDGEVIVKVQIRFIEGPNTSYSTYWVHIDKSSKSVVSVSK